MLSIEERLHVLLAWMASGMAMSAAYADSWNDHQRLKNVEEHWKDSRRYFDNEKFSPEELATVPFTSLWRLGFRAWSNEQQMLIPLWIRPHLKDGPGYFDLNEKEAELTSDFDLDHRNGCIALYIKLDDGIDDEVILDDPEQTNGEIHPFRDDEHQ